MCVFKGLIEGRAVMPGNMEAEPQSPRAPGGQMVGWTMRGEGPLSLILSCTSKIRAMYEMRWQ